MRLILDTDGKVNYDEININTTVYEVLDAVNIFLEDNPLPCNKCIDSCCRKSWSVEMDNEKPIICSLYMCTLKAIYNINIFLV